MFHLHQEHEQRPCADTHFCGDFWQLEPVTGNPLYSHLRADKKWVTSINSHVVLAGLHRFKDDPEWGEILKRIRNDEHTQHDIDAIDKCVIGPERPIPENAALYLDKFSSSPNILKAS